MTKNMSSVITELLNKEERRQVSCQKRQVPKNKESIEETVKSTS